MLVSVQFSPARRAFVADLIDRNGRRAVFFKAYGAQVMSASSFASGELKAHAKISYPIKTTSPATAPKATAVRHCGCRHHIFPIAAAGAQ